MPFQNCCLQVQSVVPHLTALHVVALGFLYFPHFCPSRNFISMCLHGHCYLQVVIYHWYHSNYFLYSRTHSAELDECLRLNNNAVGWFWQFLLQIYFFPVHAVTYVLWGMHVTYLSICLSNYGPRCLTQSVFKIFFILMKVYGRVFVQATDLSTLRLHSLMLVQDLQGKITPLPTAAALFCKVSFWEDKQPFIYLEKNLSYG